MPSSVEDDLVSWNRASLLKFWQFLLDLQKSGSLGALGVSLHAAKLPKSYSDDRRRAVITNPATPTDFLPQPMEYRRRCSTVDYFKIYHDASRTFYVRKAVDSWSYHFEPDGTKVRLLKGARFPLMDEISTAMLVCWKLPLDSSCVIFHGDRNAGCSLCYVRMLNLPNCDICYSSVLSPKDSNCGTREEARA